MGYRLRHVALAAFALALIASTAARAQGRSELVVQRPEGPRHAIVITSGDGPRPTVLVLHGALGTAAGTARGSGFVEAAARHGFNAVFADGLHRQWHDGRRGGPPGPDDVGYLSALVARLITDGVARPERIYIAGISNGGMMSFTMACKAGTLFAGVGTVIANMPAGIEPCPLKPMPLVMVNGTADPMVPYDGGEVGLRGGRGSVWGVQRTAELFVQAGGCDPSPVARPLADRNTNDYTSVTRLSWSGCRPGASVTLFRVEGGGHALPGRPSLAPVLLGPSNQDIDAADVILDVFAAAP